MVSQMIQKIIAAALCFSFSPSFCSDSGWSRSSGDVQVIALAGIPGIIVVEKLNNGRLVVDRGIISPQINLSSKSYNGHPMFCPLAVSWSQSIQEIAQALTNSFGLDSSWEE
jgi:hypothetical protein